MNTRRGNGVKKTGSAEPIEPEDKKKGKTLLKPSSAEPKKTTAKTTITDPRASVVKEILQKPRTPLKITDKTGKTVETISLLEGPVANVDEHPVQEERSLFREDASDDGDETPENSEGDLADLLKIGAKDTEKARKDSGSSSDSAKMLKFIADELVAARVAEDSFRTEIRDSVAQMGRNVLELANVVSSFQQAAAHSTSTEQRLVDLGTQLIAVKADVTKCLHNLNNPPAASSSVVAPTAPTTAPPPRPRRGAAQGGLFGSSASKPFE